MGLVLFFAWEHVRLRRNRGRLSLRICVTGARGKSSVTRLLAAALSEAGFKVLAKTTGSRPMLLLPDGSEAELFRRGGPSVLEQLKLIQKAAELSADVVVAELMSIRPGILAMESLRIFKPNILLITNARPDHTEHWGPSRETAARSLAAAIAPGCMVFVPNEEMMPVWEETAARMGSNIHRVRAGGELRGGVGELKFGSNVRLVEAVTDSLNIDRELAGQGIRKSLPDLGRVRIWSWRPNPDSPAWDCVSAFAANDPDSTLVILEKLADLGLINGRPVIGLLNLRRDRGDRTMQWLAALRGGRFPGLQGLFVTGSHARAFRSRLKRHCSAVQPSLLKRDRPAGMMAALTERASAPALILGMGNMRGAGRELVEYWQEEGSRRVL